MSYLNIISKVSNELELPEEIVDTAYKSFWEFIRQTIQSLPLKENLNEEEFYALRTNFNIPSLGKLSCTYDRFLGVKKRLDYIKKLKNAKH